MCKFLQTDQNTLKGKKILLTGGSTGIGRETAIQLASLGAELLICGREQNPLLETQQLILNASPQAKIVSLPCDIANESELAGLFEKMDNEFGEIDILVNNAAVGYGSITEGNFKDWSYVTQANLIASLSATHHAVKRMRKVGMGHIINVGSMSAQTKEPDSSVYVASKSGLRGFSESLRKEVNRYGIKVTLIEPGAVDTDMQQSSKKSKLNQIKNKEMLKAADIANAIVYCLLQPERVTIVSMQIKPQMQII